MFRDAIVIETKGAYLGRMKDDGWGQGEVPHDGLAYMTMTIKQAHWEDSVALYRKD